MPSKNGLKFKLDNHTVANAYPFNGRECIKILSKQVVAILKWTLIKTEHHSMQDEHELHKYLKGHLYHTTSQTRIH